MDTNCFRLNSKSPRDRMCGGHPRSSRCGPGWGPTYVAHELRQLSFQSKEGAASWTGLSLRRMPTASLTSRFTECSGALSLQTWGCWSPWKQKLCSPLPLLFFSLFLLPSFFLFCPYTHSLSSLYFLASIFIHHFLCCLP